HRGHSRTVCLSPARPRSPPPPPGTGLAPFSLLEKSFRNIQRVSVRAKGTPFPHRTFLALGGVPGGLMLHLCVKRGSQKDGEHGKRTPAHQQNDPAQAAVDLVVLAEVPHVEGAPH